MQYFFLQKGQYNLSTILTEFAHYNFLRCISKRRKKICTASVMPSAVIINANLVIHAYNLHSTIIINVDCVHCIEDKKGLVNKPTRMSNLMMKAKYWQL